MSQYPLVDESSSSISMLPQEDRATNPASTGTSILEKKTDFNILEKLKYLRDNKKFCDVILEVRGVKFVAHKNVLASWSPVLGSKLYSDDPKVYKDHIIVFYDNSEVFSDLLDFMYNGYVAPRETNFLQLLHLAVSFQIETLKNYCEEFLRCNLHLGNFVSTYFLSRKFKLETLEEYIVGFLQLNLSDAVKQGEFLSLKAEKFNTFLSEGWMKKIKPEIKLFLIISWVGYDVQEREKYLVVLLGHIDWSTVANDFLLEINRTENFFTTHESSLYLLLQTLFSAGIPLGPYKEAFPQLRLNHSAILKEVVHTNLLKVDTEQFNPVTILVKVRPVMKDSSVNTENSQLPCNLIETAVNTDVNSLHFEESEKDVLPVAAEVHSTLIEEQPVVNEGNRFEQFETLGDFIEAEIHEMNQKEKERLILKENQTQEEASETLLDLKEQKISKNNEKTATRRSGRQTIRKQNVGFYRNFNEENAIESLAVKRDHEEYEIPEIPVGKVEAEELEEKNNAKENYGEEVLTSEESEESLSEEDENDNDGKKKEDRIKVKGRQSGRRLKRGKRKRSIDADVKMMTCSYSECVYLTKYPQRMEKHIRTAHEASFDLRCNLCQFESKEVRKYNRHMKEHFPGPPFACDYPRCTYSTEKIQPLLTHRAVHSDERPFTCHCGMRFRTNNTLIAHKKVHLGKKEYICPDCGVAFATKNTLSQHSVKHSDIRPYLCDLCGFSTKFQSHLIAHKRIHSGEVFKCQFPNCNYSTPKRSQLKAHMRAHLGIRAHVCDTCGKTFIERSHLVRHEKLHTDSRLQCEKCEYTTTRKDKLKEHMKKHHSGLVTLKPSKKAKMITTIKPKYLGVKNNNRNIKQDDYMEEVDTPLMVKWDHGSYSLAHDSTDLVKDAGTEPLLSTEGDYCVLREQLGTSEPIQQILTIDQINGSLSVAKALDSSNIVAQAASPIINSEAALQNQTVTVVSSGVPCLDIVSSADHIGPIVNGAITSSGAETGDQNAQTYTIIQSQGGTNQQDYAGLSAIMALF